MRMYEKTKREKSVKIVDEMDTDEMGIDKNFMGIYLHCQHHSIPISILLTKLHVTCFLMTRHNYIVFTLLTICIWTDRPQQTV